MLAGVFQSHWQLNYCGIVFGKCFWCSVVVATPPRPLTEAPVQNAEDVTEVRAETETAVSIELVENNQDASSKPGALGLDKMLQFLSHVLYFNS